jgi:hypothetical protein
MIATDGKTPNFELCQLRGGPHDGQTVNVPIDQQRLTFNHSATDHDYYKLGDEPVYHHESIVSGMFGSGR